MHPARIVVAVRVTAVVEEHPEEGSLRILCAMGHTVR